MKCNTSASFPLSAEAAIFARTGQKIGKSRHIFLRNFKLLRLLRNNLGLSHRNATAPFYQSFVRSPLPLTGMVSPK